MSLEQFLKYSSPWSQEHQPFQMFSVFPQADASKFTVYTILSFAFDEMNAKK